MLFFRTTISLIAAAALTSASTACNAGKPAPTAADSTVTIAARNTAIRDSVKALLTEFTDKMSNGDLEGAGKLYSSDSTFYWIEGGSLRYRNTKELRDALLTLKNVPEIKLVYLETVVDVLSPTIASVRTEFAQTFMTGTGKGDTYGGYLSMTVVREADGWRMRNGHASSRHPRPGS